MGDRQMGHRQWPCFDGRYYKSWQRALIHWRLPYFCFRANFHNLSDPPILSIRNISFP
jgi:hypothetical protein